jgi:hypothetical protein
MGCIASLVGRVAHIQGTTYNEASVAKVEHLAVGT